MAGGLIPPRLPPPDEHGRTAAAFPPSGVTANLDGDAEWAGSRLIVAVAVLSAASAVMVALRLYTTFKIVRKCGLEDVFICVAWLLTLGVGVVACLEATHYGVGKHMWDIEYDLFTDLLGINMVSAQIYFLANMFTKLALLQLLIRLSSYVVPLRIWFYSLMALAIAYNWGALFAVTFGCKPIRAAWDVTIPDAHCIDFKQVFVVSAITNVIVDFILVLSPFPLVWMVRSRISKQQRIALSIILGIGLVGCIMSAIRMTMVASTDADQSFHLVEILTWSCVELNFSIICACAICLKPFITRYLPRLPGFGAGAIHRITQPPLITLKMEKSASSRTEGVIGRAFPMQPIPKSEKLTLTPKNKRGFHTSVITSQNNAPVGGSGISMKDNGSEGELVSRHSRELGDEEERIWSADMEREGMGGIVVERTWDVEVTTEQVRENSL